MCFTKSVFLCRIVFGLVLMVGLGVAGDVFAVTSVELRPIVKLNKDIVYLGDIADLTSSDLTTVQRLSGVYLGRSPRLGQNVSLDRAVISRWVNSRLSDLAGRINWSGAQFVQVSASTQLVPGRKIVASAESVLKDWLSKRSERSVVHAVRTPEDILLPDGSVELKPHVLGDKSILQKRMTVWVEVWGGKKFVRMLPVTFEVGAFKEAWVSNVPIAKGEPIQQDHLVKSEIDLTLQSGDVEIFDQASESMRARLQVPKGAALSKTSVEKMPLALRGEWITLIASTGAFELESRVEALQDGALGQLIKVRSKNSQEVILAKVVGRGKVEMKL